MQSRRSIQLGIGVTVLALSCVSGRSRIDVVEEYLDRVNAHDPTAALALHASNPEFAIPDQDVIRGRDATFALLQWDSVLGTRLDMSGFTELGDTVFVERGSEQNRFFRGLGLERVEYQAGIKFVFAGDRIAGIYPTGFTEPTMENFMPRMQAFMAWASEYRKNDLEQLLADGRFVYTPEAALRWLDLLAAWSTPVAKNRWDEASRQIRYLAPAEFSDAPPGLIRALDDRGCRIPQVWYDSLPHNLIRGEFARPGQQDWAALCSRAGVSQIVVFWSGGAGGVDSLAMHEDESFLQEVAPDQIGYSRRIGVADSTFIQEHNATLRIGTLPALDHQGIDDAFFEKGSSVFYHTDGSWIELAGAD